MQCPLLRRRARVRRRLPLRRRMYQRQLRGRRRLRETARHLRLATTTPGAAHREIERVFAMGDSPPASPQRRPIPEYSGPVNTPLRNLALAFVLLGASAPTLAGCAPYAVVQQSGPPSALQ